MHTDNKGNFAFGGFHSPGEVLLAGFDPCLSVSIRGFRFSTAGFRVNRTVSAEGGRAMTGERRVKGGDSWVKPAAKRVKAGDRAAIARDRFDNATGRASIANDSADKRTVRGENGSERQDNAADRCDKP